MYVSQESLLSHVEWKKDRLNKHYTECNIKVRYTEVKHVAFTLKFVTGVFLLKGTSFENWISDKFNTLRDIVYNIDPTEPPPVIEAAKETSVEIKKNIDKNDSVEEKTELEVKLGEIDTLWEENTQLKTAIKALEKELKSALELITEQANKLETTRNEIEQKVLDVEKKHDIKITMFTEGIHTSIEKKAENVKKDVETKISNLSKSHTDFKKIIKEKEKNQANEDHEKPDEAFKIF